MQNELKNICLVTREDSDAAVGLAREIADWLAERSVDGHIIEHYPGGPDVSGSICEAAELLLVLGGDGTFLSTARSVLDTGVPMLGINLGRVGFLAEVCPSCWRDVLAKFLDGKFIIENRMVLSYRIERGGREVHAGRAVNDIVVGRGNMARLVRLGLFFGEEPVSRLRADGLIVSSPTGATAYTVSADGPLVHPHLEAFCVTPICPFRNYFRPLVLPVEKELRLVNEETSCDVFLTEDGQKAIQLEAGDSISIARCEFPMRLVRFEDSSYFATLIEKGFLTER